jgi:hypothetical protein
MEYLLESELQARMDSCRSQPPVHDLMANRDGGYSGHLPYTRCLSHSLLNDASFLPCALSSLEKHPDSL